MTSANGTRKISEATGSATSRPKSQIRVRAGLGFGSGRPQCRSIIFVEGSDGGYPELTRDRLKLAGTVPDIFS